MNIINLPFNYKDLPDIRFTNDGAEQDLLHSNPMYNGMYTSAGVAYPLTGTVMETTQPLKYLDGPYGGALNNTSVAASGGVSNMDWLNQGGLVDLNEEQLHDQLNPALWNDNQLLPQVREKLIEIASLFYNTLNNILEIKDIRFTGSLANYNYNENSDIDLHLMFDFNETSVDDTILTAFFKAKKQIFNTTYDININNYPVEVGVENINTPLVSTGVYSILNNAWVIVPQNAGKEIPDVDQRDYDSIVQEIEKAIESKNQDQMNNVLSVIRHMRKDSLGSEGEFGTGNLLFKRLRANGVITRLINAINQSISDELSLDEMFVHNEFPKTSIPCERAYLDEPF